MVIILSRDAELYSTRALCYACEQAGREMLVLDVLQLEVKIGKGVFLNGERLMPSFVIPRFSSQILVAGLAVIREWESEGVSVLNSSKSIAIANDQLASLQCMKQAGLPVPESSFCSQPCGGRTYQSLLGKSPKVIKLLDSSQGKGVMLAKDYATKSSVISTLATLKSSGIVQRYYEETKGADYRLVVFRGEVIVAVKRQAQNGEFRANLHQGGEVISYDPCPERVSIALKAVEAIGLEFAGVDMISTNKGDLVLEVNASPGLQGVDQGEFGKVATIVLRPFSL